MRNLILAVALTLSAGAFAHTPNLSTDQDIPTIPVVKQQYDIQVWKEIIPPPGLYGQISMIHRETGEAGPLFIKYRMQMLRNQYPSTSTYRITVANLHHSSSDNFERSEEKL